MPAAIEIFVGDVSDVEAHVFARYAGPAASAEAEGSRPVVLRGTLRGPFCEHTRTLPAEFQFRGFGPDSPPTARAIVTDPSLWTVELPHLYQADVEARQDDRLLAEYHGMIGLRRAR
jgi:hypothetical protein